MQTNQTCGCVDKSKRDPLKDMPLAMAYVPWQQFCKTYEGCKALNNGTIFPELCLPFCGKGGRRS